MVTLTITIVYIDLKVDTKRFVYEMTCTHLWLQITRSDTYTDCGTDSHYHWVWHYHYDDDYWLSINFKFNINSYIYFIEIEFLLIIVVL